MGAHAGDSSRLLIEVGPREEEGAGEVDGAIERLGVNKDARRVLCPQKDLNFIPAA